MAEETETSARESMCKPESYKPKIIGLYGVPGAGKSYYLSKLRAQSELEPISPFQFFEGSSVINSLVPGGLPAFKVLPEEQKLEFRNKSIRTIKEECTISRTAGLVAGHAILGHEENGAESIVITPQDLEIYTHILYLKVETDIIQQNCASDWETSREILPFEHVKMWQKREESILRTLCRVHGIQFCVISPQRKMEPEDMFVTRLWKLVADLGLHNEHLNWSNAMKMMGEATDCNAARNGQLKTMLVMDGDKTLAPYDVGNMFWERAFNSRASTGVKNPLKEVFGSPSGYSYHAFRQATLLYETVANDQAFDALCEEVASEVVMYPEFVRLLLQAEEYEYVGAVVVTCGLRRVWERVLELQGLSKFVKVIGGGRISDGFVVTAEVKASLVAYIQDEYHAKVYAFGDSPLDLPMLIQADRAIVVVGDEKCRSKSMETALKDAITTQGLAASQLVLPSTAAPRLDTLSLPLMQLSQPEIEAILCDSNFKLIHATGKSVATLLTTQTRDAAVAGPSLKKAHRRIGRYLATEFISKVIGLECYNIPHVKGGNTDGHRLMGERKTTVVSLMRGGEPTAEGIHDVFPLAMFVHASQPEDLKFHHVEQQQSIILVDSVINTGRSILEFVQHVRKLHPTIRIVIAAIVVQDKFVSRESRANLEQYGNVTLVALRLSKNQFTGSGGTDTGNRLFNTTHLR